MDAAQLFRSSSALRLAMADTYAGLLSHVGAIRSRRQIGPNVSLSAPRDRLRGALAPPAIAATSTQTMQIYLTRIHRRASCLPRRWLWFRFSPTSAAGGLGTKKLGRVLLVYELDDEDRLLKGLMPECNAPLLGRMLSGT